MWLGAAGVAVGLPPRGDSTTVAPTNRNSCHYAGGRLNRRETRQTPASPEHEQREQQEVPVGRQADAPERLVVQGGNRALMTSPKKTVNSQQAVTKLFIAAGAAVNANSRPTTEMQISAMVIKM